MPAPLKITLLLQNSIFSSQPRELLLFGPYRLACAALALGLLLLGPPPVEQMVGNTQILCHVGNRLSRFLN